MRNQRVLTIVEAALCVALSVVLNFAAMRLPINIAGGSVSLVMLPLLVLALRRGALAGAGAGALFGLIDLVMEPFILVPAQVALDYPVPYLLFGLAAGAFSGLYQAKGPTSRSSTSTAAATSPDPAAAAAQPRRPLASGALILIIATLTGGALRLLSHVLSGVIFFAEYAGGQNVWVYSIVYNLSYVGPSLLACLLCALVLLPALNQAVPPQ